MSNSNSNFPSNQLNGLSPEVCKEITSCLRELNEKGKPRTEQELKERIDDYFLFCEDRGFRPGVETLCVALSCRRSTLWNWCEGNGCSKEWSEICQNAKQFIMAFLETLTLSGKLNPASSIFYLKNWGNYKDAISFDESMPRTEPKRVLSAEELPKLREYIANTYGQDADEEITLPEVPD